MYRRIPLTLAILVFLRKGRIYTVFAEGLAGGDPPLQAVLEAYRPQPISVALIIQA